MFWIVFIQWALFLLFPVQGSLLTRPLIAAHADACMYVRCSPPVTSYLCPRLSQPVSSPATSQPTSTSLLLGQQPSRGYFFCFSHLLFPHPSFHFFSTLTLSSSSIPYAIFLTFGISFCFPRSFLFPRLTPALSLLSCFTLFLITFNFFNWKTHQLLKLSIVP